MMDVVRRGDWIEMEWCEDPGNVLSISISCTGKIAVAGLSDVHGETCTDKITPQVFKALSQFVEDELDEDV